ncbi:MAG: HEAT repeat domain-containing protein [Chloroflexota bacterium]
MKAPPDPILWNKLLSGNREQLAAAGKAILAAGHADDYVSLLLMARRRNARRHRRVLGFIPFGTAYTERERRSMLSALGILWGTLGRTLGGALDPKASHFEREHAHKALISRHDPRAVRPLIEAMLDGQALEDWQCIATLGALGDLRAAEPLLIYVGLDAATDRAINIPVEFGVEVGRALREMKARQVLGKIQDALHAPFPRQRIGSALVLAGWGDEKLAPLIAPLITDTESQVRLAAANAIGELRAAVSLAPLQAALTDPDPQVRLRVEWAVQQVTTANAQRAVKAGKIRRADPV